MRLVHASPNTPPLELVIGNGAPQVHSIGFGEASEYLNAPAGTLNLAVRLAGDGAVVAAIPDATLVTDRVYTFVVIGVSGGMPPPSILPLVDPYSPIVFIGYPGAAGSKPSVDGDR